MKMEKLELSALGSAKKVQEGPARGPWRGSSAAALGHPFPSCTAVRLASPCPHAAAPRAPQVTVTKDDTILLHGGGDKAEIRERCDQIREAIATTTSDYDR